MCRICNHLSAVEIIRNVIQVNHNIMLSLESMETDHVISETML